MLDGTAAIVEQFISKLNKILDDRGRRSLHEDYVEDTLRVSQNHENGQRQRLWQTGWSCLAKI